MGVSGVSLFTVFSCYLVGCVELNGAVERGIGSLVEILHGKRIYNLLRSHCYLHSLDLSTPLSACKCPWLINIFLNWPLFVFVNVIKADL